MRPNNALAVVLMLVDALPEVVTNQFQLCTDCLENNPYKQLNKLIHFVEEYRSGSSVLKTVMEVPNS